MLACARLSWFSEKGASFEQDLALGGGGIDGADGRVRITQIPTRARFRVDRRLQLHRRRGR